MKKNHPGIFERPLGSGVWWIRYRDGRGKRPKEKAGTFTEAVALLAKRKHDKLLRKKMPELLLQGKFTFKQLGEDAIVYSKEANVEDTCTDLVRKLKLMGKDFNSMEADTITKQHITAWLLRKTQ